MTEPILTKLADHLFTVARRAEIDTVWIGLGYTAVRLRGGHTGLAWTPPVQGGCSPLEEAGTLTERPVAELLRMVEAETPLPRAVGLATANALLNQLPRPPVVKEEIIESLGIAATDRVAMVGYFGPLVQRLRQTGCQLDIIELDGSRPGVLSPDEGRPVLARCNVAIVTGTSLVTGTCEALLADLGQPREAVLLGPSSPFCPEIFAGTPLTRIAGARVVDSNALLRVVSEGGGTPRFKPYVCFETMFLSKVVSS